MTHSKQENSMEYATFNWIRSHIESKGFTQNIPYAIKGLIQKFTEKCLNSQILSVEEDMNLVNLLQKQLSQNIKNLILVYRASENNFESMIFYEKFAASNIQNSLGNIVVIQTESDIILGGYTSKSWTESSGYIEDEDAFLFVLKFNSKKLQEKVPWIFHIKKTHVKHALYCYYGCGPCFGAGWDIYVGNKCNPNCRGIETKFCLVNGSARLKSYFNDEYNQTSGWKEIDEGMTKYFDIKEYEVFQIKY